jgi:thioredoxin 1
MTEDEELEKIRREKMKDLRKVGNKAVDSEEPIKVTDATFKETVEKNPALVIDCWAPWCGPCRMVSPVVNEMSRDYNGRRHLQLQHNEHTDTACV